MKQLLYLFFLCAISFTAKAQNLQVDTHKLKQDPAYRDYLVQWIEKIRNEKDTIERQSVEPYLVNPKPGIHFLPQDNMPCIVPDKNATVAIPNGWRGKTGLPFRDLKPKIPNPAKPLMLAPARPLLIKPNPDQNTK